MYTDKTYLKTSYELLTFLLTTSAENVDNPVNLTLSRH